MKKVLVVGIIVFFIVVSIYPSSAIDPAKESIIPLSRGDILYVGGSGSNNYTSIQAAIDDAVDGDTVFVYDDSSPYYENIIIDKSIELIGENKQTTIINGSSKGNVVKISTDFVKISSVSIQYSSPYSDSGAGIRIDNSDDCIISDCEISQNGRYGIFIWTSINCRISGNTISKAYMGICIEYDGSSQDSSQCVIEGNIIDDNSIGFYITRNRDVVEILNNIISNNGIGIGMNYIFNHVKIKGNKISGNLYGVRDNGHPNYKKNYRTTITISENTISSNEWHGVYIFQSGQSVIYKNNFENNAVHAYFELLNFKNCFRNKWSYLLKGNYWDDWTGSGPKIIQGKMKLRIGDLWSTNISWINYDLFPSSVPYEL